MTQAFLFFHFNLLCQKLAYFCFAKTTAVFLPFLYCFFPLPFAICGILLFVLWKFTRFFILCCFIRCLFGAVFAFSQCLFVSTAIFLPFYIVFFLCLFPFAFGTFRPLPFGSLLVFLFYVVSFAVFLGQYSLFCNVCLFQQPFSYLFVYCLLPLCLLPFAFGTFRPLPFEILPVVFLLSVVSFAVFLGQSSLFAMSVCFNSRFLTFFILFFALCLFSFAFGTFRPLPFSILQTAFCPLLPPFVVFFLFCVWDSPFALLLTAICCKNLLLDKKFSKNKKSLEIVIKTFDNT